MEIGSSVATRNPANPANPANPWFRPSADMVLVDVERDTLLYHRGRGRLLVLNPSAAAILRLCDGTRPEDEIARCLEARYPGVDRGDLEGDVRSTVDELTELGVLTRG